MKKGALLTGILFLLILISCERDSIESSYWKLYDTTYKAVHVQYDDRSVDEALKAYTDFIETLNVRFKTKPTSSSTYDVLDLYSYNKSNAPNITTIGASSNGLFFSTGRVGDKINVQVLSNGKLKVTISNVEVGNTTIKPTILSGVLFEQ